MSNIEWTLVPEALEIPLRRRKPTTWFVNSMSDLFHESVENSWIDQIFAVMALTPQHTYQILTKRPERMLVYLDWCERRHNPLGHSTSFCRVDAIEQVCINKAPDGIPRPSFEIQRFPLPNVWLGVSVEDQQAAEERIPLLLKTPAAVRFLSCEPLLGEVEIYQWLARGFGTPCPRGTRKNTIDWVIVGGESGPGARPCDPEWIESVVRQCSDADVPCFVKQTGSNPVGIKVTGKGNDPAQWPRQWPRQMPKGVPCLT